MEELKYEIPKSMEIVQYSDKALLLTGDTKPYKEELRRCTPDSTTGWVAGFTLHASARSWRSS